MLDKKKSTNSGGLVLVHGLGKKCEIGKEGLSPTFSDIFDKETQVFGFEKLMIID